MEEKEIAMDKKVMVRNLAPWNVAFPNKTSSGDTCFAPSGRTRVKREEIVAQADSGNRLFNGIDTYGSHATLYVEDDAIREYIGYDSVSEGRKQVVINDDAIKKWFELKTQRAFEKNIEDNVKTMAEKTYLLEAIKRLKLDSYEKIEFCKEYCKFRLI